MTAATGAKPAFPAKGWRRFRQAGRAPGCLLRLLTVQLGKQAKLGRAAAWCRGLAARRPRPTSGPLFGVLLAEVAGAAQAPPVDPAPQQQMIRRGARVQAKQVTAKQENASGSPGIAPGRQSRATGAPEGRINLRPLIKQHPIEEKAKDLPPKASPDLLQRWVPSGAPAEAIPTFKSRAFSLPMPVCPGRQGTGAPPAVLPPGSAQHAWPENLVRRIRSVLAAVPEHAAQNLATRIKTDSLPAKPLLATLDAQWQIPLQEPWISFLPAAQPAKDVPLRGVKEERDPSAPINKTGPVSAVRRKTIPTEKSTASTNTRPGHGMASALRTDGDFFDRVPADALQLDQPDLPDLSDPPVSAVYSRPEPTLGELLQQALVRRDDSLLARGGRPTPFPVKKDPAPNDEIGSAPASPASGTTVRLSSQDIGLMDSETLAEQIGRILADEARRHGIDV